MLSIHLDDGIDHVFTPGSTITGRLQARKQVDISKLQIHLTGKLRGSSLRCGEIVFVSVIRPVFEGTKYTVRAGHEWTFSVLIPDAVDWQVVDAYYRTSMRGEKLVVSAGLNVADLSTLPKELPPSIGKFELDEAISILYELRAYCMDPLGNASYLQGRWVGARAMSEPRLIELGCPREVYRVRSNRTELVDRFTVRSFNLEQRKAFEPGRSTKKKFHDILLGTQPPGFSFRLHFKIPHAVIAGQKLDLSVCMAAMEKLSNGNPAPSSVTLTSFELLIRSHTGVVGPVRADQKTNSSMVHVRNAQITKASREIELKRGIEIDLREHMTNFGVWAKEIPCFETYAIQRTFVLEFSGVVEVADLKYRFRIKPQDLRVYSPLYNSAPAYQAGTEYLPPPPEEEAEEEEELEDMDAPPPTYMEATATMV